MYTQYTRILVFLAVLMLGGVSVLAQMPEKFSYQAVIRNAENQLVVDTEIGIQISMLQGSEEGEAVYVETHAPQTNANGLISIEIGGGNAEKGKLAGINWGDGPYFIHTAIDINGGTNYNIEGVQQILSVPFAIHAKTSEIADSLSGGIVEEDPVFQASPAAGVEEGDIGNWREAYSWGDHSGQVKALEDRINALEKLLAEQGYHLPITDVDGNSYRVVQIGNQLWMGDNLRTSRYSDGTPIQTGLTEEEWATTSEGAFEVYDHEAVDGVDSSEEMIEAYGALYNWYAVVAERGLCPTGWRVPTTEDFNEMVEHITSVYEEPPGVQLKSCRQINSPHGGDCATEEHPRWHGFGNHNGKDMWGFGILPAGVVRATGGTINIGLLGYFWTANEVEEDQSRAYFRSTGFHLNTFGQGNTGKGWGHSIRCIRE